MKENDKQAISSEYKPQYKALLLLTSLFLNSISLWAGYSFIEKGDFIRLIIYVVPVFVISAIGLITPFYFRINVYKNKIERISFIKRTIEFSDVKSIFFSSGQMKIKVGYFKSISITKDLKDQEIVIEILSSYLKAYSDIRIWGDQEVINRYFGNTTISSKNF